MSYLFSFKNIYTPNMNSSNLMFFTGPTKSGKSWLLRQNLEKFKLAKQANPVVFHFDLSENLTNENLSFDMFLVQFERMIIAQILRNKLQLFGLDKDLKHRLNPVQEIYRVALKFYDK